jgi:hypothetical protein
MIEKIAAEQFESTLDYAALPKTKLLELLDLTKTAHRNLFHFWQEAVSNQFGAEPCAKLTAQIYPNLAAAKDNFEQVFYEELNFVWMVMPELKHMLTFARYDPALLPESLDAGLDLQSLSSESVVMLWNLATLTYVMQTGRWVEAISAQHGQDTALKLEREVWLDRGAAEEDLRYGLIAAGADTGNVETLLRGFQMAPGEVGLVDAEFQLENPNHGWITHKRCPAHDRFRDSNRERLESSCVICVVAMRLSGEMVNENIRCRPASLPPHHQASDHACRWEYWLENR